MVSLIPDRCISTLDSFSVQELQQIEWKDIASGSQASVTFGSLESLPNENSIIKKLNQNENSTTTTTIKSIACKNFMEGINAVKNPRQTEILDSLHILQREAWAMEWCKHPCIISALGVCIENHCLLMEFAPAGDLYSLLYNSDILLSWKFIIKVATDISIAMNHLHSNSPPLFHRDLKSPNILVSFICFIMFYF